MSYYSALYDVGCHHTDENNNIRPTELVRLLQETANRQMRDRRPSYVELFAEGKAFIITRLAVEVYRQLHQFDQVEVRTWICPGKAATFPRAYEVWKEGVMTARAYSEWAVANRFTGGLCRANEVDISEYEQDKPPVLVLPKRVRFPKEMEFRPVETKQVRYGDCDMNRHMNNANYFDMLWNHIPGVRDLEITSMNIRYMHEAPLDSRLVIGMQEADPAMTGDEHAKEAWAFKTVAEEEINVECLFGMRDTKKQR